MEVADTQLLAAARYRRGFPPRDHRHDDTGGEDGPDAVSVASMEGLVGLAGAAVAQPPIGHYSVHIQHQEADARQRRRPLVSRACWHQTTPARSRSWTLSAPISRRSESVTSSAVT